MWHVQWYSYLAIESNEVYTHTTNGRSLANIMPRNRIRHKVKNCVWFHLYELPLIHASLEAKVKFVFLVLGWVENYWVIIDVKG